MEKSYATDKVSTEEGTVKLAIKALLEVVLEVEYLKSGSCLSGCAKRGKEPRNLRDERGAEDEDDEGGRDREGGGRGGEGEGGGSGSEEEGETEREEVKRTFSKQTKTTWLTYVF